MKTNKQKTILYFANGGYLMKALLNYQNPQDNSKEITLSAKRIWSKEKKLGYGVLIRGGL